MTPYYGNGRWTNHELRSRVTARCGECGGVAILVIAVDDAIHGNTIRHAHTSGCEEYAEMEVIEELHRGPKNSI
jgi:hypothetical protein